MGAESMRPDRQKDVVALLYLSAFLELIMVGAVHDESRSASLVFLLMAIVQLAWAWSIGYFDD